MLARWEVGACAVLALCSVGAVPHIPPISPRPENPTTTQASDCGLPSHRPVALDTYTATWSTMTWAQENLSCLHLINYSTPLEAVMSNDGDSVYVDFPDVDSDDAPHIDWKLNETIIWRANLTRLSFHWPSEHVIDGKKSFLELHMEHKDDQGMTTILAYTYDICPRPRSGFDVVSEYARKIKDPGSSVPVPGFVPQTLMPYGPFDSPMVLCDYFVYEFSESPSMQQCAPSVYWLVYKQPQCVSEEQMDVDLLDDKGGTIVHLDEPLPLVEDVHAGYLTCF